MGFRPFQVPDIAPEPINHHYTTQSLGHYELLSEAASDTILTMQYKKTEANTLLCSENTAWPTTKGGPLPDLTTQSPNFVN